jgi:hypothetical protein
MGVDLPDFDAEGLLDALALALGDLLALPDVALVAVKGEIGLVKGLFKAFALLLGDLDALALDDGLLDALALALGDLLALPDVAVAAAFAVKGEIGLV